MVFNIFYGYQFFSKNFKKLEFENLVAEACKRAESILIKNKKVKIKIIGKCINLNQSTELLKEITSEIENADACIFEISDNNPNVFLEFGYALGLHKPIILIVNAKRAKKIPADIKGLYRINYLENQISTKKSELVNFIKDVFADILKNNPQHFWQKEIGKTKEISIFLGANRSKSFSSSAIFGVEVIRKKLNSHSFKLYCEKEISGLHLKRNIISIGGPLYNHATQTILKLKAKELKFNFSVKGDVYCISNSRNRKSIYKGIRFSTKNEKPTGLDYGVINIFRNTTKRNYWIIIAALTGAGTHGLIEAFFTTDTFFSLINLKKIDSQHQFFCEISICNGISIDVKVLEHIIS